MRTVNDILIVILIKREILLWLMYDHFFFSLNWKKIYCIQF